MSRAKIENRRKAKVASDPAYADRRRRQMRNGHLKHRYGITLPEFEALRVSQDNRCACCSDPLDPANRCKVHLDHCHATGKIRGILCQRCNVGLGLVEAVGLQKLVEYLGK